MQDEATDDTERKAKSSRRNRVARVLWVLDNPPQKLNKDDSESDVATKKQNWLDARDVYRKKAARLEAGLKARGIVFVEQEAEQE